MQTKGMKKNPRDEDLYTIIQKNTEEKPWKTKLLQDIIECEQLTTNTIIILDNEKNAGVKITVTPHPTGKGLLPIRVRKVFLLNTQDDWEKLPQTIGECTDTRIIKHEPIVLIECMEPQLQTNELITVIKDIENPLVECYYEWE